MLLMPFFVEPEWPTKCRGLACKMPYGAYTNAWLFMYRPQYVKRKAEKQV